MSRPVRIVSITVGAVLLILAIAVVTGIKVAQSDWLREKFRERIVAEAERATGGRVEIGAFKLDWRTLTAELDNLIIHGTEPAGDVPLLTVKQVVIGFRIISLMERAFDVQRVTAESPQAHLIIQPDGSTNIPQPKTPPTGKTGPETILDLKIGKFDLADGVVIAERTGNKSVRPWNARGENLAAHVNYNASFNATGPRYDGAVSVAPVDLTWNGVKLTAQVAANASMEKNRLTVSNATLKTGASELDLSNVLVDSFTNPVTTAQYKVRVSLADADRIFKLVDFQHTGAVFATGDVRFVALDDYMASAAFQGAGIGYGKIRNMRVSGNLSATPVNVRVKALLVSALGGEMAASGEVRNLEDFHLSGQLRHFDAAALASLGGVTALPFDGIVSGPFDATGKVSESELHRIVAEARLVVSPTASGEPLHGELGLKYDEPADTIALENSWLELPKTRVDATGVLGRQLALKLQTQDLNELRPVLGHVILPITLQNGSVAFEGSVNGPLAAPRVAGHGAIQNAIYHGQQIDSLAGDFTAMETGVTVNNAALALGNLRARVSGSIALSNWKPVDTSAVTANVQIANADIPKLLTIAGQKNLPITGTLNTTFQVGGTVGDPHATADLRLTKGQLYGEPYDSVTGRAQYLNGGAQQVTAVLDAGRKRLNVTARFDHSPTTFLAGKLTFNVSSNAMALNQISLISRREPGIEGSAQLKADGAIEINRTSINRASISVLDLNADLNARGLGLGPRSFGDAHFSAQTKNGTMTARLDSDAAKAAIHGEGTVGLAGDYPIDAKLTFSKVGLSAVAAAMIPQGTPENFDGSAAGEITLRGPAMMPDQITASIDIPQFELHPLSVSGDARNIPNLALKNTSPIHATLAGSIIRVESAHFQAPSTDLNVTGTVKLKDQAPLGLRVQGNMNLALAQTFSQDLMSSGELLIDAAVRGSYVAPDISGRAELQKGDFHYAGFSNGLTNANSVIVFNGPRANIQSFSGESGGGKVQASGFAALTGGLIAFRLEAKTRDVRVRYPAGVSTISDSDLTLTGTSQRSQASGTVTIHRVSITPKSDLSTILESAAQPMRTPEASAGVLANMNLDVEIATAPDVAFETSVAQSIEADANLRLRGTAINPAVLGRVNITEGELEFFGNKYTINQGSVSFFNPAKIDPILNVDLETKARGVEVTLTVTGPINKLNVSYRSDPPLQWADIIALLATGRAPTDPTLAVQNTGQSQNLQQLGASALVGQAISNPVAGNLQRFFGVSRIKVDPQLIGITGSPEARLTIEQQVSPDLLFTYISDVSSTSTQLFQVEWDFSRRWAAILTREENGYVGVDFAFKKRFK
jgi:translocation and assembly module TamB